MIRSSLFAATDRPTFPTAWPRSWPTFFSGSIDFRRALRKEDRFSVVYETLEADGEPLRSGRVLSAEFLQQTARRTKPSGSRSRPRPRGLLPARWPEHGARLPQLARGVHAHLQRLRHALSPHPEVWRAHLGTDFAAPTGTPVRSVGDGVVEFAGVQNGYGNVVFVKHGNGHETVYAHLSRMDVRKGQSVARGDTVGAVGATGWATGPHLHFEFRVNGQRHDPMTIARQSRRLRPVSAAARPRSIAWLA